MKLLNLLIGSFLLCGCSHTIANYEKMLDSWVGRSTDELVNTWGVPSGTYEKSDRSKVVQFEKKKISGLTGYPIYDRDYLYPNSAYGQDYIVTRECTTIFYVDKDGIITSWQWKGNACGLFEPGSK